MKLSQRQLRRLIEAEVDKMRLPKGPNSRDDGEDRPLETKRENVTEAAFNTSNKDMIETINDLNAALQLVEQSTTQGKTDDRMFRVGMDRAHAAMQHLKRLTSLN